MRNERKLTHEDVDIAYTFYRNLGTERSQEIFENTLKRFREQYTQSFNREWLLSSIAAGVLLIGTFISSNIYDRLHSEKDIGQKIQYMPAGIR